MISTTCTACNEPITFDRGVWYGDEETLSGGCPARPPLNGEAQAHMPALDVAVRDGWRVYGEAYTYGNDGLVRFGTPNDPNAWYWCVGHVIPATREEPADYEVDVEGSAPTWTLACETVEWIAAVAGEMAREAAEQMAGEWEQDR